MSGASSSTSTSRDGKGCASPATSSSSLGILVASSATSASVPAWGLTTSLGFDFKVDVFGAAQRPSASVRSRPSFFPAML